MKIGSFLMYNGVYLLFCAPILAIIWCVFRFGLKSKIYYKADLMFLLGGVIYWAIYEISPSPGKTLSNAVAEPFYISIIASILFLTRSLLCKRYPSKTTFIITATLLILLVSTIAVFLLTPSLPE